MTPPFALSLRLCQGPIDEIIACSAVLFDMDNTLLDSSICVQKTWRMWAARHGLDAEAVLHLSHGRQNHETMRLVDPQLDNPVEHAFMVQAEETCVEGIVAVPGAAELLRQLPPERWAVVTSAWRKLAELRLHCADLPTPRVFLTSDEIPRSKPHPDGYLAAAAQLGVEPAACVVIEDAHAGIEAARAAGMRVIAITTTFPREQLGCQWCIDDFRSLSVNGLL